nr:hypothetical protein [Tanacetum cinerariifolium]
MGRSGGLWWSGAGSGKEVVLGLAGVGLNSNCLKRGGGRRQGIDKTDCYPEEDIHLVERLLYDNSSPRPPKEFVSENSNAKIESFSPSPIPNEDSDSFMKEIDDDDDDSERDILILEELPSNYSLSLPEKSPDLVPHEGLEAF